MSFMICVASIFKIRFLLKFSVHMSPKFDFHADRNIMILRGMLKMLL